MIKVRHEAFKVLILDFDGVVVESNDIKHQAFSDIFSAYPSHYREIMEYHYAHNAVNRHDKFRYIMEQIFKQQYDAKRAEEWAERFSRLTRERIIQCPFVAGALDFLTYFSRRAPLYLASATPLDELTIILRERHLSQLFKGVYGAPMPKKTMFNSIGRAEQAAPADILYIGDSIEDYEAAKSTGCRFIARKSGHDLKSLDVTVFSNLEEIKTYLT